MSGLDLRLGNDPLLNHIPDILVSAANGTGTGRLAFPVEIDLTDV